MPIAKTCLLCGSAFRVKPKDAAQRFCSANCRRQHEVAHGRQAALVERVPFTCQQCGEAFYMKPGDTTQYRRKFGKDRPYCSMTCMGKAKQLSDEQWQVSCIQCGRPMPIQRRPGGTINRQKRLCSTECRSLFRRISYQTKHADDGPTRQIKRGYVRLIIPGKDGLPSQDVLEHRWVMSQHLGRDLLPEETVHHIDGDRQHNAIENLELFSSRHGPGQRVRDKVAFAIEMLLTYPEFAREQGYRIEQATKHA